MDKLFISLAYKYVAIAVMLTEASNCSERLGLRLPLPIGTNHVHRAYVSPPRLMKQVGAIDTTDYSFCFGETGRLRYIVKLNVFNDLWKEEVQLKLSRIDPTITTNEAYGLATNWLQALSVDVEALQRNHPVTIEQQYFFGNPANAHPKNAGQDGKVLLPIFDIVWGKAKQPAVIVTVFGPTKELWKLRQEDESFSRRAQTVIKDIESLLNTTDAEFLNYTEAQRSNLVVRFAAVDYSKPNTNSPNGVKSQTATNSAIKAISDAK